MTTNNHIWYEGSIARIFHINGKEHAIFSIPEYPIYFSAPVDADSQTFQEALLRRYHALEALYTPQRFTNPEFKIGLKDKVLPLEIDPVEDSKIIAILEKRL
ncbi:hypothetical protein J4455_00470 [Candidatus Woesearchaeota archaeon]|nr:hypothetical protein [Candidatus Woesearchaeota archaeon]